MQASAYLIKNSSKSTTPPVPKMYCILAVGLLLAICGCGTPRQSTAVDAAKPRPVAESESEKLMQEAAQALATDGEQRAAVLFDAASRQFARDTDSAGRCDSLVKAAYAYLMMGHADKAEARLDEAEQIATTINKKRLLGRIYALRGNLLHVTGDTETARQTMEMALFIAEQRDDISLMVSLHNDLGNLFGSLQKSDAAIEHYRQSAELGKQSSDPLRTAIALTNAAKVSIADGTRYRTQPARLGTTDHGDHTAEKASILNKTITSSAKNSPPSPTRTTIFFSEPAQPESSLWNRKLAERRLNEGLTFLAEADRIIQGADVSQQKAIAHLNIGLAYMAVAENFPEKAVQSRTDAQRALSKALDMAQHIKNVRLTSYAHGHLGRVYLMAHQHEPAADHTREAIYWAGQASAPESLYRWEWQYAKILTALKQTKEALDTYRLAIATLESIRAELPNCYGRPRAELRQKAGELYLSYVDLLLNHVKNTPPDDREALLRAARETVEKRKVFELREYFNDDCLGASAMGNVDVERLLDRAAVVYPIILPDRLEIIASFPSKERPNIAKDKTTHNKALNKHYTSQVKSTALNESADALRHALESRISNHYLRYSQQLYDWLISPLEKDLAAFEINTIVFVPDGGLRGIPMAALHDGKSFLMESYAVAVTPGLYLTNPTTMVPEKIQVLAAGISEPSRGYAPLPGVADELQAISSLYSTKVLMNDHFSLTNFEQALKSDHYNIVHIASHGKFSENIEESFILAADKQITLDALSKYVGLYRFREQPLELLTLSACETAAGNDKAALGLAGIAVKIGARSALATLWAVDDRAAAELTTEFYTSLRQPGVSRAMALQRAQRKLLNDPVHSHPGYWSPFILINNWL